MSHRHKYGVWEMFRPEETKHLSKEEFVSGLRLAPFWVQRGSCGFSNWYRSYAKPKASFKFNDHWKASR